MPERKDAKRKVEGYERDSGWYDESFENNEHWRYHYTQSRYYPLWAVISDRLTRSDSDSVLDIGCGSGQLASLLRDKGLSHYLGLDFSPKRIEWARKVCPEFEFQVADVFETRLLDTRQYDTVVCTEFLEHVSRDTGVIEKIPSGSQFYASVPNFPFESHVRYFESAESVYDRYSSYFNHFNVDIFPSNAKGRVFYLAEGTKI